MKLGQSLLYSTTILYDNREKKINRLLNSELDIN